MQPAKQMRLRRNCSGSCRCAQLVELLDGVHPLHAELRLLGDGRDVLDRGEGGCARVGIGDVVVEQRQVELDVHRLFKELAREIQARFGRVDVLVEIEHEVVRDDGVAGGEEGDEALDEMDLRRREARAQVDKIGREVDLFDGPGVVDAVLNMSKKTG